MYNFGLMTFNLTRHMHDKKFHEVRSVVERFSGPLVITIHVDKGIKKDLKPLNLNLKSHIKQFLDFVRDKELNSALYEPPRFVMPEQKEIKSINLDEKVVPLGRKVGFSGEAILINSQKFTKTANIWGVSNNNRGTNTNRIVLFKKRKTD